MVGALPKLRPSGPADWGVSMSVCIGAICEGGHGIVLATDMMVSMGWVSRDAKLTKAGMVSRGWHVMFAGNDISPAKAIIEGTRKKLESLANEASVVANALAAAYQEKLRSEATDQILAQYGWTLETFLRDGYKSLGPDCFADVKEKYEKVKLECDFILCGFDSRRDAHIFTVSNPGVVRDHSDVGFWAIGSGEYMALASLMAREQLMETRSAEVVAYYVCEAKYMAELASGVGKTTILLARRFAPSEGDEVAVTIAQELAPVRAAWEKYVRGKEPQGIEETMKACLKWKPVQTTGSPKQA